MSHDLDNLKPAEHSFMAPWPFHRQKLDEALRDDHQQMERVFERILEACHANAAADLCRLWTELESRLIAHMALEEKELFPRFAQSHASEVNVLLGQHAELRKQMQALGIEVDIHAIREQSAQSFIDTLRNHALREDTMFYGWVRDNIQQKHA